jgi:serine protease Do
MASFDDSLAPYDPMAGPPPRPTTPPVRLVFLVVLGVLLLATLLVYGIPYVTFRAGYAYEAGRARAAEESLARLDEAGVINRASALFRAATLAVAPAVVNIQCLRDAGALGALNPGGRRSGLVPYSFGSGVVIDKRRGFIVTNGHVVAEADEIYVRLGRSQDRPARLVGADAKTDLAVLQVDGPLEAEAEWADVRTLDVGDWVLAIGSPFTLESTVTHGIVSATGRRNLRIVGEGGGYEDFIQTDAPINPGNSGGPLVDLRGHVVGINTAMYVPPGGPASRGAAGNVGIGFAISAELARNVVEQIIANGRVVRGYLGVILDELWPARARALGLPDARGALIMGVDPESPAARAGLRPGDVIRALDDRPIEDVAGLRNRAAALPVGAQVGVHYIRDGKPGETAVTIEALPTLRALGMRIREHLGAEGEPPTLLVEQVDPGSPAFFAGVEPGQRLIAVGNRPVASREEAETVAGRFDEGGGIPVTVIGPDGRTETLRLGGGRRRR